MGHRRAARALALLAVLALGWLALPVEERPTAEAPASAMRPTGPHRPARSRVSSWLAPEASAADEDWTTEIVVVALRPSTEGLLVLPKEAELDPDAVRPLGLDADDADRALDDLGVFAEPQTAPDALLMLEAERRRADARHHEAWLEALEQLPENEIVAPDVLIGTPSLDEVFARADELEDLAVEAADPVYVDLADLYRTEALWRTGASAEASALARDLLATAVDDAVAAQAGALLGRLPRGSLAAAELARLADLCDAAPPGVDPRDLAALGLDVSLRAGGPEASDWARRLEREVDLACDRADLGDDPRCATEVANVDHALGHTLLRDPADAADWRQALELAAFACSGESSLGAVSVEGEARFDEAWSWPAWEPRSSAFTRCLEREAQRGPEPDRDHLLVRITIVGS